MSPRQATHRELLRHKCGKTNNFLRSTKQFEKYTKSCSKWLIYSSHPRDCFGFQIPKYDDDIFSPAHLFIAKLNENQRFRKKDSKPFRNLFRTVPNRFKSVPKKTFRTVPKISNRFEPFQYRFQTVSEPGPNRFETVWNVVILHHLLQKT